MTILFTGGGTLGSVTPLLAVAEEIRHVRPRAVMMWIGTRRGPERVLVERDGIRFIAFPAGKLRRYLDGRNIVDAFAIAWAFVRALAFLRRERPDTVVGAGSYVQVPVMLAARVLRIPIVIHQLDARPSLANTLVARFSSARTATFGAEGIGVPVRAAVRDACVADVREAQRHFGFSGNRHVLLILGGGTGAMALNHLVWAALPELTAIADVIHVTGKGKQGNVPPTPAGKGEWAGSYRQFEFLADDMIPALAAADLVVSRAGMGTIAELGCLGKPTVLVPMPSTHQEDNAQQLNERGAAEVWNSRALVAPGVFTQRIHALLEDANRRAKLGRSIATMFPDNAAATLARVVMQAAQ
ncbi:MAG: UDP-N-acetylglucosamine--N-acetylmuramyl-(pentapeptide) pyrophosphoryl-undecaprenol N-acetylglucosamine transferase [bacterium]|nr:UDP-N-acetylglucosamine--N-acetylmuramyl-(pentapeptide) pyrophosphoryl-undecaprenol N-acetylglucosamine transferase [bacterium]